MVSAIYEWKYQILSPSLNYFFLISIALIRDLHRDLSLYSTTWDLFLSLNFRTVSFKGDIFFLSYIKAIRVDNSWEKGDTLWLHKRTKVSSSFLCIINFVSIFLIPLKFKGDKSRMNFDQDYTYLFLKTKPWNEKHESDFWGHASENTAKKVIERVTTSFLENPSYAIQAQ